MKDKMKKLPDGWQWARLGDVCYLNVDKTPQFDGVKPYYDTGSVGMKRVEKEPVMVTFYNRPNRAQCYPQVDTVGFAKMKGTNKTLFIDSSVVGSLFSNGFQFLIPKENKINPRFLYAVVGSDFFQTAKNDATSNGIMANIKIKDTAKIMVPLPPLAEQERIVVEIDRQQILVEQAQKLARAEVNIAKTMPSALFREVLHYGENKLPDGWQWAKLGDKIRTMTPPFKFPKTQFGTEGKFPIIDQSQNEIAGWTDDESVLVKHFPVVVFGDHTCCIKYLSSPFAQGADGIKIIATADGLLPKFLYYWLQQIPPLSLGYRRHFGKLKSLDISFPPLAKQQQIVADFDCRLTKLQKMQKTSEQELNLIKAMPAAILRETIGV